VEGAEYQVLQGAERILKDGQCRFLIEVHPWGDPTIRKKPEHVFQFLNKFGYSFRRVNRHWLFEKRGEFFLVRAVKVAVISFVWRCKPLKEALKKIVLWRDRFRQRKQG
jgi:hypothetical protein